MTREPLIVAPGEGRPLAGGRNRIKAGTAETEGRLAIIETVIPPGREIPAHVHGREDEAWYIIEGLVTFRIAGRTVEAPAGSFVLVPQGTVHAFANTGDVPARFIELFAPAGMERYFEERNELASTEQGGDYAGLDPAVHAALARKYHMEFVESDGGE